MSVSAPATPDDRELIEAFVRDNSETAFRSLVDRHARWMFAAAFRQLRDRQLAEDAAQAVFIILLQKAHAMPSNAKLSAWLFSVLQFTVKNLKRAQRRRHFHEFRAAVPDINSVPDPAATANDLSDRLDVAVASLHSSDRATILLRFYQNLPFDQIARSLGISEAAARKRTNRAIQTLRRKLGVNANPDSIAIGAAFGLDHSPAALTHTITTRVLAAKAGAAIPATILTATKGTLFFMAATKTKIIAALVIFSLFAVPGTIVAIHYAPSLFADSPTTDPAATADASPPPAKPVETHSAPEPWEIEDISSEMVGRLPPEVRIVPTKFSPPAYRIAGSGPHDDKFVGIRVPVSDIVLVAYKWPGQRMIFADQPPEKYDFIATQNRGSLEALRVELKRTLGFTAHKETRVMDVLLMKVANPNAPGLMWPISGANFYFQQDDNNDYNIAWDNQPLSRAPELLEICCKMPVIDKTGVTGNFRVDVKWKELGNRDPNHDSLKKALLKTLGLELVPSKALVEMLIVEKVKP